MKNIFKLMGVALLASSMLFVSCNKDEEENNDNNQQTSAKVTVVFGGTTWTSNDALGCTIADGVATVDLYQTGAEESTMQFSCGTETNVTYNFYNNEYYVVYWDETEDGVVEYDRCSEESHLIISALDIDNKTISAALTSTLYAGDAEEGKTVSATLNNAVWE